jgi:predicted transcriptional regulator
MNSKLSKLQKRILHEVAKSEDGVVSVSSLYDPHAENLNAARAATSRAISRLQDRGLVERLAVSSPGLAGRKVPAIRIAGITN